MREIVPSEIIRILSLHGPVQLVAGPPGKEASIRAETAPFEDVVFLFVRPRSELLQKTRQHSAAQIYAKHPRGEYSILMKGRAVAGPGVMAHTRRSDLLPWVPEGANPRGFTVVSFFCEEMEYRRQGRDEDEVFIGKTPLGREAPRMGRRWLKAAFGGITPITMLSVVAIWIYLLLQGKDYPFRFLGLGIATLSIVALQAGARLWYRATAFLRWLEGRAHEDEAEQFTDGLLAPGPARQLSAILSALGLALAGTLSMWPNQLALVTLGVSLAWIQWPIWVLHLTQNSAEPRIRK